MQKFEDLTITNDFLFGKVMYSNKELCKRFLEIILDIKIRDIQFPEIQKSINISSDARSVRLDVYVEDDENTVYDMEMQVTNERNLPKRSRYYQGMIDLNNIQKGDSFNKLKKSYVVFICTFDPFGKDLSRYTFINTCLEQSDLKLDDGTFKVFINPYGKFEAKSNDYIALMNYLQGAVPENEFIRELELNVQEGKNEQIGGWNI